MKPAPDHLIAWASWIAAVCLAPATAALAAPALSAGRAMPLNGNLTTPFTFQVTYTDPSNGPAPVISLVLDGTNTQVMTATNVGSSTALGQVFRWQGTLPKARHQFRFATPNATGDLTNHWGPVVSDQPLTFRDRFFYFPGIASGGDIVPVGDVNGDGYPDLLHTSTPILFFGPHYNWADGVVFSLPTGASAGTVRGLGDVDGDGCADFVFGNDTGHVVVYRGRPDGHPVLWYHFTGQTLPKDYSTGHGFRGVDLDRDGHPDLVTFASAPRHGYNTTVVTSRFGPDLTRVGSTDLGVGPESIIDFSSSTSIVPTFFTDRNGDGYPDLVVAGAEVGTMVYTNIDTGGWGWWLLPGTFSREFLSINGPIFSTPTYIAGGGMGWNGLALWGDYFGNGQEVFSGQSWNDSPRANKKYATANTLGAPGILPAPIVWGTVCLGAGDVTGDGLADMAAVIGTNLYFYTKTAADPFTVAGIASADGSTIDSFDCLGDVDGNGLDDLRSGGRIILPAYPYPITTNDLPAHFTGRARDLGLEINTGWKISLAPNGTLDLKVGPPQGDGRAPIILLADTFKMPDTVNGTTIIRLESAGRDGTGWITVTGPNAGQLSLEMNLRLWMTNSTGVFSDTVRVFLTADPPMNFNTGYLQLKGYGKMPNFLASYGIGSTLNIRLNAYVDYVPPTPQPALVRLPATLHFPTRNVAAAENVQTVWLCNLSEQDLRVTSITTPGLPFQIKNLPALFPVTIAPHGTLALAVGFAPTAVGGYTDQIAIRSNDPLQTNQVVALLGYAIPVGEVDSDNDGLPDSYEARYLLPTSTNAFWGLNANEDDSFMDFDRDGASNLSEYYAGTDPTDPTSGFRVQAVTSAPGSLQLCWPSVSGRSYTLLQSSNLAGGFVTLAGPLAATPPTNTCNLSVPGGPARFYRILVKP